MNLQVCKLPDPNSTFRNVFYHNYGGSNKGTIYIKLGDSIYRSIHSEDIGIGFIGIGERHRYKYGLIIGDNLEIIPANIVTNFIDKINIKVSSISSKKIDTYIKEENIIKQLKELSDNKHYYHNNQLLILKIDEVVLSIDILIENKIGGYLDEFTLFDIHCDKNINLISNNILNPDLFSNEFDFSKLNIGGLNEQLILLFRRALITRAYKSEFIEQYGIKHVKGVLLYGPPGCGKSLIASNIGKLISKIKPKIINGPEIMSKFVGHIIK